MDPARYEYQSEFAKRYLAQGKAQGKAEGKAEGRAELVLKQLALRFGALPAGLEDRIRTASIAALDTLAEKVLTAASLDEVLAACLTAPSS